MPRPKNDHSCNEDRKFAIFLLAVSAGCRGGACECLGDGQGVYYSTRSRRIMLIVLRLD